MFEDKTQSNNNQDKDINLLPEKMRRKENLSTINKDEVANPRYTTPTKLEQASAYQTIPWWAKILGSLGFRRWTSSTGDVGKKSGQITPLQKLYAQDIGQLSAGKKTSDITTSVYQEKTKPPAISQPAAAQRSRQPISSTQPQAKLAPKQETPERITSTHSSSPLSVRSGATKPLSVLEKIDQQLQKGLRLGQGDDFDSDQYGVNLIPEEMISPVNRKKIVITLVYSVLFSVILLAAGYVVIEFIHLQEAKKIQTIKQEIQTAETEFIAKSDDLKNLIKYQQTYDNIKLLLSSHIYWDKFFTWLENNVADDVYYIDVSADKNGLVNINLQAQSYEALANQYEIFKNSPEVKKVEINSASLSTSSYEPAQTPDSQPPTVNPDTPAGSTLDLRQLLLENYQNMSVSTQINLQLDTSIFYRTE